jgi:PhnB protein
MHDSASLSPSETEIYQRPGLRSITPYLIVLDTAACIDFLRQSFGAIEVFRVPGPDGSIQHAELTLGNGGIELSGGNALYPPAPAAIHLYVDDADTTFARAIEAGATALYPVADQHWGDRQGAVKDPFGNHWYIAKANWAPSTTGMTYIPSVQPFLHINEAHKMLAFALAVFAAETLDVVWSPTGTILHATQRIGDATFEIQEATPEFPSMPASLHVYVPNTDAAYTHALEAGAASIEKPRTESYGDRAASVRDPWGNRWFIATYLANEQTTQ